MLFAHNETNFRTEREREGSAVRRKSGRDSIMGGKLLRFANHTYDRLVIDWRSSIWWNIWEVIVYGVTIAVSFLAPYEVAFVTGEPFLFLLCDLVIYMFFVTDMVLHFFVALPDPDRPSCLLRSPGEIVCHYVTSWLFVDLISVLPYGFLLITTGVGSTHLRSVGLCRIARLPRLLIRQTIMRRWQIFFGFSFAALEVVKYLLIVAMACHWMACLWGGIGLAKGDEDNWLKVLARQKGQDYSLYTHSQAQVYSVCLYWAIMTLTSVGYGDVCPMNMKEYWVCCCCMALSAALWAFIIGEVCRIAASVDPHDTRFMQTMDDLNYLMKSRHMPRSMSMQIRTYMYEAREVARQRMQTPIIQQMSPMLQGQMAMQLHKAWLEKVWYLREIDGQALVNIARRLQADFFAPNEEVACSRTLFILRRGICIRRSRILLKGDIWGEDMVVNNQVLRDEAPVKAISYLEVITLSYVDLVQAVKPFPEVCAQIQKIKVKIAVMRGVMLVARALRDVAFREEIDISEITEEVEQYVVQKVLTGNIGSSGPRASQIALNNQTRTRRSAVGGLPSSASPETVRRAKTEVIQFNRAYSGKRKGSIENDDENVVVKSDLQGIMAAIQQLAGQLEQVHLASRASQIERF